MYLTTWNSDRIYRDNMTYKDYWSKRFQDTLSNTVNTTQVLSIDVQNDIWSKQLVNRLPYLTSNDTILNYENILSSWCNLLNEWCRRNVNKYSKTYLYIAKIKYHPDLRKIGITYDIENRKHISNDRYYDYKIIHEYDNRYAAAYAEYKIRTRFCRRECEVTDSKYIHEILNYHVHENRHELKTLGWKYYGI